MSSLLAGLLLHGLPSPPLSNSRPGGNMCLQAFWWFCLKRTSLHESVLNSLGPSSEWARGDSGGGHVWGSVGCISQVVSGTHFPSEFVSEEGQRWLPERGSRPCTHPLLLPVAVLQGGWGWGGGSARVLGPGCRCLCWVGLGSHHFAGKPTHLALLAYNFKELFFSPVLRYSHALERIWKTILKSIK